MSNRYIVEHEAGSDWKVVDTKSFGKSVATGLTEDEAEETANARNKAEDQERAKYI